MSGVGLRSVIIVARIFARKEYHRQYRLEMLGVDFCDYLKHPNAEWGLVLVSFSNFRTLDPEMADTTRELMEDNRQDAPFLHFMNTWMAFNGWMESVTEEPSDAAMITALAENRRMTDVYGELVDQNAAFRNRVMAFAQRWPVLNVKDVRKKLGRDAFWQLDRNALFEACRRQDVKMQPIGWTEGALPTWPQLLRTIYLIRCNLFHGAKSPQNGRDRDLVDRADWILRTFIRESGCFDWYD
jgi:hypothetical protein